MKNLIKIIENCPCCYSVLRRVKDQLFCENDNCPAQQSSKIFKFAQKMKIKGLGVKRIELLELEDISEIYEMPLDYLIDTLGEKVGEKLFKEIELSKRTTLEQLLPAFSIPLIGDAAASKLATEASYIEEINDTLCKRVGLGKVATANLLDWLLTIYVNGLIDIPFVMLEKKKKKEITGSVAVTGKVEGYTRASIKDELEGAGFRLVSSISAKTDFLVCEEEKPSSKLDKARKLNIKVVTLKELINNDNNE